jgi:Xaa-Pro dipeptidase
MHSHPPALAGLDNLNHPHLQALSFPREEYQARVRKVRQAMAALNLDALLCHTAANICYLTGFEAVLWYKYTLAVIPREGNPVLLAQDFEMPNACATVWMQDWVTYPCHGDPIAVTKELLTRHGLANKRLGIELNRWSLSVPTYQKLRDTLSSATLVDATAVLDEVKMAKSPAELAVVRQSAELTSRGMIAALERVRSGATDNDVAAAAYQALIGGGSEYMAIDPIVTVGARSSIPHSTHRRVPIGKGESTLIEVGACVHRYSTATMRTAVTKPLPDLPKQMYEACRASVDEVVRHTKPGAVSDEVAAKADAVVASFASQYIWHGYYGYSLGLGFPPDWNDTSALIIRGSDLILKPGMVFHVSTSLRKVGVCGVAFSETMLVTETGAEVLTKIPRNLHVAD